MRPVLQSAVAMWPGACALTSASAQATDYPARPISIVVPFVAGGAFDVIARLVFRRLDNELGVSVIALNLPPARSRS